MASYVPRLVIAGLSGDAGKTVTSLSLLMALRCRGRSVTVFKKGPDYIDAAWLAWASGTTCRNLDTYLVDEKIVRDSFLTHAAGSEFAIIEGNRGLFDGKDAAGTHSTASLARLLKAPVVLVVNGTKSTRTVAAMVKGCQLFEPDINLAGVILNQVSGVRHRKVITEAIETSCGLPVVGCIPKLGDAAELIPGRHLGLVTPSEFAASFQLEQKLEEIATAHLDIDQLLEIAAAAPEMDIPQKATKKNVSGNTRIGYFHDTVFTFYYPENLEALEAAGATLVPISSLADRELPDIDALYIGGGFPETHAEQLTDNRSLMDAVKAAADQGLPIYAECGGLIFLSRSLHLNDKRYPMAGVFPVDLQMNIKPVGHGYTEVRVDSDNPFFELGTVLRGHEFHYTGAIEQLGDDFGCMSVNTGTGLGNGRDGLVHKNCLAAYTHIHADGTSAWAASLVQKAEQYRSYDQTELPESSRDCSQTKRNIEPTGVPIGLQPSGQG